MITNDAQLRGPAETTQGADRSNYTRLDASVVIVGALTALTFVVRLLQIHQGLFGDEMFTDQDVVGRGLAGVLRNVHTGGENSPPLFFAFAWLTAKLGDPSVWIRLPSIVLGAATLPIVYLIGRETVGRWPGTIAAGVLAFSPFSFYYGVEARPYASMAFFVGLSTWALLRAVRSGVWWWVLYTAASVAAAYSHYTSVFVLFAQWAWSLWVCRDRVRIPALCGVAGLVLYAPWLPHLRGKQLAVISLLEPLTAKHVVRDLLHVVAGYSYGPLSAIPTIPGLVLIILAAAGGAIALTWSATGASDDGRPRDWPPRFWLLVALSLATPVGMLIYSLLATDVWLARGLYASVPAAALVLGTLLHALPRPVAAVATTIVLATLAFGMIRARTPTWQRPQTRAIARYVDDHFAATEAVAIQNYLPALEITEQLKGPHRFTTLAQAQRLTRPGSRFVLIRDSLYDVVHHVPGSPAAPAGFTIAARRTYLSPILSFEVTAYRRSLSG